MKNLRLASRARAIPESSTVRIADLAAQKKRAGETVIDMSAGRASEHTDREICDAASAAMQEGKTHQVEARGMPDFLEAIAEKLKRENKLTVNPQRNVIATMGCKQGLMLALAAILDPDDEVLVESPCFVSYAPEISLMGGRAVPVPLRPEENYRMRRADLEAAITDKTKAILFCSPHNPLGIVHTHEDLALIADIACHNDLFVIADEIYEAVTWGGRKHVPIASLPSMKDRAIGLMGMTKSYSMGGWRLGYAYAAEGVISVMVKMQQHLMTCGSSINQQAGIAALSNGITMRLRETVWTDWEKRLKYLAETLDAAGNLSAQMPEGGFYIWLDISKTGMDSTAFCEGLLEKENVTLVPGITFAQSADNFVRVTGVKSWEDVKMGAEKIINFSARL